MNPNQGVFLKNFLQCFSLLSKFSNSFTVRFQFLCFMKYIFSNVTYYHILSNISGLVGMALTFFIVPS